MSPVVMGEERRSYKSTDIKGCAHQEPLFTALAFFHLFVHNGKDTLLHVHDSAERQEGQEVQKYFTFRGRVPPFGFQLSVAAARLEDSASNANQIKKNKQTVQSKVDV